MLLELFSVPGLLLVGGSRWLVFAPGSCCLTVLPLPPWSEGRPLAVVPWEVVPGLPLFAGPLAASLSSCCFALSLLSRLQGATPSLLFDLLVLISKSARVSPGVRCSRAEGEVALWEAIAGECGMSED